MPKCKKDQVINPKTGWCIKKDGAVWKRVFRKKSRKRTPKRKSQRRKSRKKGCKSGYVINPKTGRCIKEGGAVWKRIFGEKKPSRKAPKRKSKRKGVRLKTSPFHRELEEKLIVKAVCGDLKVTRYVKSYLARTHMLLACINNDIPLRASVSMWDRWVRGIKKVWSEINQRKYKGEKIEIRKMEVLYKHIQGEHKYCFRLESANFIADLYLRGYCNCLCGTSLLFALTKYIDYKKNIVQMLVPGHTFLLVPGKRPGTYMKFETTRATRPYSERYSLKELESIDGFIKNEMYGAMYDFFDFGGIRKVKKNKFFDYDQKLHLQFFKALYPENPFTTYVANAFTRPDEFERDLHDKIADIIDVDQLSVLRIAMVYFAWKHRRRYAFAWEPMITKKIARLLKKKKSK